MNKLMHVLLFIAEPVSGCPMLKSVHCVSVYIHLSQCLAETFATGEHHVNESVEYRGIITV